MNDFRSGRTRRSGRRWTRVTGVAAAALVMAGCYNYQPVDDGPTPPPTETVRIELTGAGEDAMLEERGIVLEGIEGRILEERGDELTVLARLPANRLAYGTQDVMDTLRILRPHVRTMDIKQFSTGRTVLGVAGGLAAMVGVYAIVDATVSSSEEGGTGEGGGVVISVVPWVTTVLGWLK